jgi:hypothetical protein
VANVAHERGQLILVAGLTIAVTFVVLALVLNGVIYTENLGTRTTDVGERNAVATEALAVEHVESMLPYGVDAESESDAVETFEAEIDSWTEHVLAHEARSGTYVRVAIVDTAVDSEGGNETITEAEIRVTYENSKLSYRSDEITVTEEGRG